MFRKSRQQRRNISQQKLIEIVLAIYICTVAIDEHEGIPIVLSRRRTAQRAQ